MKFDPSDPVDGLIEYACPLATKAIKFLHGKGVRTVGQFTCLPRSLILQIPGVGKNRCEALIAALIESGLVPCHYDEALDNGLITSADDDRIRYLNDELESSLRLFRKHQTLYKDSQKRVTHVVAQLDDAKLKAQRNKRLEEQALNMDWRLYEKCVKRGQRVFDEDEKVSIPS